MSTRLFSLGQCVITPGAQAALLSHAVQPTSLLLRHQAGDWQQMDKHDQAANHEAVKNGFRVFSSYDVTDRLRIWVITEADRSVTTILLPSEY